MRASPADSVRADRWLWAARLFKSRALAAAACTGGKVEVNEQSAKPARLFRPGDLVRVTLPAGRRIVRILALAQRRGPRAAVAGRVPSARRRPSDKARAPPARPAPAAGLAVMARRGARAVPPQ